ncbi:MAG: CheR family methyltransferase, partial [Syntrophales bacterium]
ADVDPGMAFVLVQHLAPDPKSILPDLIRRYTRMQVFEVTDGMVVQPNCAYIIPPNRDMAFLNGTLQLLEPVLPRGQRLPIDFFFRSLAQDQHERAIGIVLSGTGSDGTLGIREIKGKGGLAIAQNPESCEYDGLPRSAIATGLVDYVLPPAEMQARLIAYAAQAFGRLPWPGATPARNVENALDMISLLRAQTGHDFSQYKPSHITRRIDRRMAIHQITTMDGYLKYMQQTPVEVEALFRDMLIGVTNFFRDPEAFKMIEEQIIPKLLAGKHKETVIRIWIPACTTGEEAYSLAILLAEYQEAMKKSFHVQVFATDIDNNAIATARIGLYPASIAADVSPERLSRFFTIEPGSSHYRIHKGIRDMLVFSEQSIIKDPPLSKLDLISCRNLLIYLDAEAQKRLIPLFHYALNPGGVLVLGTSETVVDFLDLFAALNNKLKIYLRRDDIYSAQRAAPGRFLPPVTAIDAALPRLPAKVAFPVKLPLRELTEQALLQEVVQVGALINSHGDILYFHGRTGSYLEPQTGGTGVSNILKMAREGLRQELTLALRKALLTQDTVRYPGLRVKTNHDFTTVNLTIRPVSASSNAGRVPQPGAGGGAVFLYLVILEEAPLPSALGETSGGAPNGPRFAAEQTQTQMQITTATALQAIASLDASPDSAAADFASPDSLSAMLRAAITDKLFAETQNAALKQELRARDKHLQTANEEMETSNEELKSSNKEMQSVNEELQSTNEELETSKEELQSVNEELATVNNELQTKVTDLSQANNDMSNLLSGTGIATLFVDHHLHILRFTPTATRIINLILSDVGRPVAHIASNLVGYGRLVADTEAVLDTLIPKEAVVQTTEGRWYNMRIQPYRTLENVIEGAVITFVDITEEEKTREALRKANKLHRLAVVVRDAHDAITVQDTEGRIIAWNPAAVRMYGWSETEALAMNVRDMIPERRREEALARVLQLSRAEILEPYQTQRIAKDGAVVNVSVISTALVNEAGKIYAIATTERAKESQEA